MDYREYAKDLLAKRNELIKAKANLDEEIEMLDSEKYSVKHSALYDTSVGKDGGTKYEDHLVNIITVLDNAVFRRSTVVRQLKMIESGLSVLDSYERDIVDAFYIYRIKQPAEVIMAKYYKTREQVFNDKKKALERFTRGVYGLVHL